MNRKSLKLVCVLLAQAILRSSESHAAASSAEATANPGRVERRVDLVREEHWAFNPPMRPEIPLVKNRAWLRNPIDAFVLARLEQQNLAPSAEADRATLIRRLSLDLLGLPPAPSELNRFVNDRDPAAYESLVARLLASPHFGERWARPWLDLARYADSDGYEDDKLRPDAWRYRDWVIEAF